VDGGPIASLKVHKNDVSRVGEDRECGIAVDGFDDFRGDEIIETYALEAVQPSL
jgi:translation initiation factor IF-2